MRILTIGGSPLMTWVIRRLTPKGTEVVHAANVAEVKAALALGRPAAVVLNVTPPHGLWRTAEQLCRAAHPPVPTICYSPTYAAPSELGIAKDAENFFSQPLKLRDMQAYLNRLLAAASQDEESPKKGGKFSPALGDSPHRPRHLAIVLAVLLGTVLPGIGEAEKHPRLVDVATSRCTDCHDDLWTPDAALHAPAEADCTMCHEFEISDDGTSVTLLEEGTALCLFCHDELSAAVEASLEVPHFPVTDDCLTCHDPHGSTQTKLLHAPPAELCATCHDAEDLVDPHGGQLTEATDCQRCHAPHGSDNPRMLLAKEVHAPFSEGSCKGCHRQPFGNRIRLRSRGEKLCVSCHGDLAVDHSQPTVHAALKGERGRAGCLTCHDPHMSSVRKLLLAGGPELCSSCHEAVVTASTAATGHAAAEDCLNCHLPHSSENRPLLSDPAGELCGLCHDVEDAELTTAHLGADLAQLTCTSCHTPHGSEHGKLLAENLHEAIEGGCEMCHDGASDSFLEEPQELCLMCHDDVGEAAAQAAVPHAALELGSCVDCHNPHASAQEHLVKLPGGGACIECHDEQAPAEGETAHTVIEMVGCRACHEPHGGDQPKMLRREGNELCLSCHDPRVLDVPPGETTADSAPVILLGRFEIPAERVPAMTTLRLSADGQSGHPVAGHRALGRPTERELRATDTTYDGEVLTCLTCHNPHKGRSQLLAWNAASPLEACVNCHPK